LIAGLTAGLIAGLTAGLIAKNPGKPRDTLDVCAGGRQGKPFQKPSSRNAVFRVIMNARISAHADKAFYWVQHILEKNMGLLTAFAAEAEPFGGDLNMPKVLWLCLQDGSKATPCVVGMDPLNSAVLASDDSFMRELQWFGPNAIVVRASLMLSGPMRARLPLGNDAITRTIGFLTTRERNCIINNTQARLLFAFDAFGAERKPPFDAEHEPPLPAFPLELAFGAHSHRTINGGDRKWKSQKRTCSWCAEPCTQKCGRCKYTPYCSKECLAAEFNAHKGICRIMAILMPRESLGTPKTKVSKRASETK
jgi:hypothetical protein